MSNPDPNNPVAYAYDPIGSRVLTTGDTETEEHFADALNQHTLISNPVNHVNPVLFFPDLDASGQLAAQFTYDAWGNVLSSTIRSSLLTIRLPRYLFQGCEYSYATGLYNFRARWYDPATGRWLSTDPIGISGGLNLYAFCGNNPVNIADPDGLKLITHGDKRTEAALDAIDQASQKNLDKATLYNEESSNK